MFPIINIGPLAIQAPGLIILLGLWLGLTLAERYSARFGVSSSALYNLVFIALVAGVVGARLAYVLRYPQAFAGSPISLISLNPSLLDPWGGLAGGLIAALIYGQRKNIPLWPALDALTPMFAVLTIAISISQLASGTAFGAPAELPWSIHLWGVDRHPSQIYAALASALILIYLWTGLAHNRYDIPGVYFLEFLALNATARLFLEAFRGDSILLPGGFRLVQVAAWILLAACLWGLTKRRSLDT